MNSIYNLYSSIDSFQDRCSYSAAYRPIFGTIPAVIKVSASAIQSLVGILFWGMGSIASAMTDHQKATRLSRHGWINLTHGLKNMGSGVLEGIPIIGAIIYYRYTKHNTKILKTKVVQFESAVNTLCQLAKNPSFIKSNPLKILYQSLSNYDIEGLFNLSTKLSEFQKDSDSNTQKQLAQKFLNMLLLAERNENFRKTLSKDLSILVSDRDFVAYDPADIAAELLIYFEIYHCDKTSKNQLALAKTLLGLWAWETIVNSIAKGYYLELKKDDKIKYNYWSDITLDYLNKIKERLDFIPFKPKCKKEPVIISKENIDNLELGIISKENIDNLERGLRCKLDSPEKIYNNLVRSKYWQEMLEIQFPSEYQEAMKEKTDQTKSASNSARKEDQLDKINNTFYQKLVDLSRKVVTVDSLVLSFFKQRFNWHDISKFEAQAIRFIDETNKENYIDELNQLRGKTDSSPSLIIHDNVKEFEKKNINTINKNSDLKKGFKELIYRLEHFERISINDSV